MNRTQYSPRKKQPVLMFNQQLQIKQFVEHPYSFQFFMGLH